MEEKLLVAQLEEENSKLKEENKVLFLTVAQMRNSINLLIKRYIANGNNR